MNMLYIYKYIIKVDSDNSKAAVNRFSLGEIKGLHCTDGTQRSQLEFGSNEVGCTHKSTKSLMERWNLSFSSKYGAW